MSVKKLYKKFVLNPAVYMTSFILLLPALLIVKLTTNKKFGYLRSYRIGHQVGNADLFIKRHIDHLDQYVIFTQHPANICVQEMLRQHLNIIESEVLCYIFRKNEYLFKWFNLQVSLPLLDVEYREFETIDVTYELPEKVIIRGASFVGKYLQEKEFICFHSRDSQFLKSTRPDRDFSYHDFRDTCIENFFDAIEYVDTLGYTPVRMGSVATQIDGKMPKALIDYSCMPHDPYLDVYLCASCKFYIGNSSGLFHLPKIFNKPFALANFIPYPAISPKRNSLFTPKLVKDKEQGHFLTFAECQKHDLFSITNLQIFHSSYYVERGLEVIENDAQDMLDLTKDMFDLIGNVEVDKETAEIQRAYKDKYLCPKTEHEFAGDLSPSFARRYKDLI